MRASAELIGQAEPVDGTDHRHRLQQPPRDDSSDTDLTDSPQPDGETIDIDKRVVVSPVAGVFTPLITEATFAEVGQRIGQMCTRTEVVAVCTPFTGQLVVVSASKGERVHHCQRVAWLRQRP